VAAARSPYGPREVGHRLDEGPPVRSRLKGRGLAPAAALERITRLDGGDRKWPRPQAHVAFRGHELLLDREPEIAELLCLCVVADLQIAVDQVVDVMQPVFRNAALALRLLPGEVGLDVVLPTPEQHVGV
jgi:hypothetical protein